MINSPLFTKWIRQKCTRPRSGSSLGARFDKLCQLGGIAHIIERCSQEINP